MIVDEVYRFMGMRFPLDWENHVYDTHLFASGLGKKGIGSTTHMVVEAVLDRWMFLQRKRIRRVTVVVPPGDLEYALDVADRVDSAITSSDSDVSVYGDDFVITDSMDEHTGLVYLDHELIDGISRALGAHRLTRMVRQDGDNLNFLDRDQRLLMRSTLTGVDTLLNHASCPIYDARVGKLRFRGITLDP